MLGTYCVLSVYEIECYTYHPLPYFYLADETVQRTRALALDKSGCTFCDFRQTELNLLEHWLSLNSQMGMCIQSLGSHCHH